jgi:hypothetical protein
LIANLRPIVVVANVLIFLRHKSPNFVNFYSATIEIVESMIAERSAGLADTFHQSENGVAMHARP